MTKELELAKSKRIALYFLLGTIVIYLITLFLPRNIHTAIYIEFIKAAAEAGMVGALADWFAVAALFKRIPIPIISNHTEIIPKNKHNIALNLSAFVRDKFFDIQSISTLIKKHDPANYLSIWLQDKKNTEYLGTYLIKIFEQMLNFIEDKYIQQLISKAIHATINQIDLSKTIGTILEALTKDNKHQDLLNECITYLACTLENEETQKFITNNIILWLEQEHPIKEKVLPSQWIGKNVAEVAISAISRLLSEINANPQHQARITFDKFTQDFIYRLKTDSVFMQKAEEIKNHIQNDEAIKNYISYIWASIKNWIKQDLANSSSSVTKQKIIEAGQWLGQTLALDTELRNSINMHIEESAKNMAPDFAEFLEKHIKDTIINWDMKEISHQIELNIGKDLQFIRINGTIVGAMIGFMICLTTKIVEYIINH